MLNFINRLRSALAAAPAKPKKRARLEVEVLEHRLVPTVAFQPQLGTPTVVWGPDSTPITAPMASNPTALNSSTVHLIFWGPDWVDRTGKPVASVVTLERAAQAILNSNYLSGLKDYGSNGQLTYGAPTVDGSTLPASPDPEKEIQTILSRPGFSSWRPAGGSVLNSPIYVVVMDNAAGGVTGWNHSSATFTWKGPRGRPIQDPINSVYIGLSSVTNTDGFSMAFSHELAERVSDGTSQGIGVNPPPAAQFLSNYQSAVAQVSDNEPDQTYNYRLNGSVKVQAYWSLAAGEYIVPDGDPGHLYDLTPSWSNVNTATQTFNNSYTLTISPGPGDIVTISQTKDAGGNNVINVTWNGHTDTFDSDVNQLTGITVNVSRGAAIVHVQGSVANTPVTVNVGGPGTTSDVTVGDGNVQKMYSPVTVNSTGGTVNLVVDDSADNSGPTATLALGSVTDKLTGLSLGVGGVIFSAANVNPTIKIGQGSLTVDDSASTADRSISLSIGAVTVGNTASGAPTVVSYLGRLKALKVVGGRGNDAFRVDSTPAGTTTTLVTGTGTNTVFIGERGVSGRAAQDYTAGWTALQKEFNLLIRHTLADIAGAITVQANPAGKTSLTVDDSGEVGRGITVSSGSVTFSGVPAISYSGLRALTLVAGAENPSVSVGSVPPGAAVTLYNDTRVRVTGPAASQVTVIPGLPSWDGTDLLPYLTYVPQIVNWNLPTPDPFKAFDPGVQESVLAQAVFNPGVQQSFVARTGVAAAQVFTAGAAIAQTATRASTGLANARLSQLVTIR